jgi:hypothetical protein
MAEVRSRIEPLSNDLGYQISSSSHITSPEQVIEGLLRNALDAEARKVVIEANLVKGQITVRDNGHGIEPFEFSVQGHLAKDNCATLFVLICSTPALMSQKARQGGMQSEWLMVGMVAFFTIYHECLYCRSRPKFDRIQVPAVSFSAVAR